MSELKPCPFCGSEPLLTHNNIASYPVAWIHCRGADHFRTWHKVVLNGGGIDRDTVVTEKWNTRPIEDELRQALEEVKEIYDMDVDTFTEKYGLLDLEEAMIIPVLLALKGTGE